MDKTEQKLRFKIARQEKIIESQNASINKQGAQIGEMRKSFKVEPSDRWYIVYLQRTVRDLEEMCNERQHQLERYQKHYSKWGTFYQDFIEKHEKAGH